MICYSHNLRKISLVSSDTVSLGEYEIWTSNEVTWFISTSQSLELKKSYQPTEATIYFQSILYTETFSLDPLKEKQLKSFIIKDYVKGYRDGSVAKSIWVQFPAPI